MCECGCDVGVSACERASVRACVCGGGGEKETDRQTDRDRDRQREVMMPNGGTAPRRSSTHLRRSDNHVATD